MSIIPKNYNFFTCLLLFRLLVNLTNLIQFVINLYVSVFLYIGGLVSIPCMLEKDCNGNPISTFPPCYAFQMNWPLGWFSLQVAMSVIGCCSVVFFKSAPFQLVRAWEHESISKMPGGKPMNAFTWSWSVVIISVLATLKCSHT